MKKLILLSISCTLLLACEPAEKRAKRLKEEAESLRIHCLDNICEGDLKKLPPYNYWKLNLLKLNNVWYTAPKTEFNAEQNMARFNWPIHGSIESLKQTESIVEMTLFANRKPSPNDTYAFIKMAEKNNGILSRTMVKKGLDKIIIKPNYLKETEYYYMINTEFYITTKIKDPDGKSIIAVCYTEHISNRGYFGYHWRDGINVSFRMNQAHCEDTIELYKKSIGLLNNIKRLTP
jgi:hypothetical protein